MTRQRDPNNPELGEKNLIGTPIQRALSLSSGRSAIVDLRMISGRLLKGVSGRAPLRKAMECSIMLVSNDTRPLLGRGYSVCRPMDKFDVFIGRDIAFKRALLNVAAGKEEFILREEIREAYYKSRRNYMLKKKGLPVADVDKKPAA